ncbi:MAG: hypothetical protein L6R38_008736 [Xanthoria sp. 2 TBL-2021]|nr:MAG: hypothetical protein L6R38_008736 [Xanthoria sp. 2 TBL-2021]
MATEFIGSIVTVTLNQPHDGQVRGLVEGIAEGQRLDLKNVTWLDYGTQVPSLSIETSNIKDLNIEPEAKPLPAPQISHHRSPDPAILSFDRNVVNTGPNLPAKSPQHTSQPQATATAENPKSWGRSRCPECRCQFVGTLQDRASNINRHLHFVHGQQEDTTDHAAGRPASPDKPESRIKTSNREITGATATLSGPFTDLTLDDPNGHRLSQDQEQSAPGKTPARKRNRNRRPVKKSPQDDPEEPSEPNARSAQTPTRAAGWGEPPFLQETSVGKKPHPLDAPIHRAEQRLARARKGRRNDLREEQNGWATEEATDIQDLGEFDFEGNLSKFDKHGVFEQIRQDDTTADEARLVSFNRLPTRPGTNGGKNLHYTENVLSSPQQNGRTSWNGESDDSNDRFSSGRGSRRNLSRASIRKPPSRKSSTMVPQDQTSSSGFPNRYSSQEHPSPRIVEKGYPSQHPRSESLRSSKPSFRMITSGTECPCVTPLQMLELEQLATFELGLSDDMINENAARSIAQLILKITTGKRVFILAGNTKTGARAVAAARQLRNHGMRVSVFLLGIEREEDILEIVRRQLDIYRFSGGQLLKLEKLLTMGQDGRKAPTDLIVDALLGMHLSFEDLGTADQNAFYEIASWANSTEKSVLAIDVPSGVDAGNGLPSQSSNAIAYSIVPNSILALGAPKAGLLSIFTEAVNEGGKLRKIFVADIGISNSVWKKFGTRRRFGVEFGGEWVAELEFVTTAGGITS